MRIQKKSNDLYQSKLALGDANTNASGLVTLNSNLTTLENTIYPLTGSITSISGGINSLNSTLNGINNDLSYFENNYTFLTVQYTYNNNLGYSTSSTTPFAANLGSFATYTKRQDSDVLITVTFGMRTGSFTGAGANFFYRQNTASAWESIGSVNYRVLNSLQTSQFSVINTGGAGTYTFGFAGSVTSGTSTLFIDTVSVIIQEIN